MAKVAIIYHADCRDGFGAAWAAWRKYGNDALFFPAQYGDKIPSIPDGSKIEIYDFSYERDQMQELHAIHGVDNVELFDHHKTAIEKVDGLPNCNIDLEHSGAWLAWDNLHKGKNVPRLIQYVQDRDLWKWELKDSKSVSAYISSMPMEFETWNDMNYNLFTAPGKMVSEGDAILRQQDMQVQRISERAWKQDVAGYNIRIVNSGLYQSEIGHEILQMYPSTPFAGIFFINGNQRIWSLRSRSDFDVSTVARDMGGGGHPQAAGFSERVNWSD